MSEELSTVSVSPEEPPFPGPDASPPPVPLEIHGPILGTLESEIPDLTLGTSEPEPEPIPPPTEAVIAPPLILEDSDDDGDGLSSEPEPLSPRFPLPPPVIPSEEPGEDPAAPDEIRGVFILFDSELRRVLMVRVSERDWDLPTKYVRPGEDAYHHVLDHFNFLTNLKLNQSHFGDIHGGRPIVGVELTRVGGVQMTVYMASLRPGIPIETRSYNLTSTLAAKREWVGIQMRPDTGEIVWLDVDTRGITENTTSILTQMLADRTWSLYMEFRNSGRETPVAPLYNVLGSVRPYMPPPRPEDSEEESDSWSESEEEEEPEVAVPVRQPQPLVPPDETLSGEEEEEPLHVSGPGDVVVEVVDALEEGADTEGGAAIDGDDDEGEAEILISDAGDILVRSTAAFVDWLESSLGGSPSPELLRAMLIHPPHVHIRMKLLRSHTPTFDLAALYPFRHDDRRMSMEDVMNSVCDAYRRGEYVVATPGTEPVSKAQLKQAHGSNVWDFTDWLEGHQDRPLLSLWARAAKQVLPSILERDLKDRKNVDEENGVGWLEQSDGMGYWTIRRGYEPVREPPGDLAKLGRYWPDRPAAVLVDMGKLVTALATGSELYGIQGPRVFNRFGEASPLSNAASSVHTVKTHSWGATNPRGLQRPGILRAEEDIVLKYGTTLVGYDPVVDCGVEKIEYEELGSLMPVHYLDTLPWTADTSNIARRRKCCGQPVATVPYDPRQSRRDDRTREGDPGNRDLTSVVERDQNPGCWEYVHGQQDRPRPFGWVTEEAVRQGARFLLEEESRVAELRRKMLVIRSVGGGGGDGRGGISVSLDDEWITSSHPLAIGGNFARVMLEANHTEGLWGWLFVGQSGTHDGVLPWRLQYGQPAPPGSRNVWLDYAVMLFEFWKHVGMALLVYPTRRMGSTLAALTLTQVRRLLEPCRPILHKILKFANALNMPFRLHAGLDSDSEPVFVLHSQWAAFTLAMYHGLHRSPPMHPEPRYYGASARRPKEQTLTPGDPSWRTGAFNRGKNGRLSNVMPVDWDPVVATVATTLNLMLVTPGYRGSHAINVGSYDEPAVFIGLGEGAEPASVDPAIGGDTTVSTVHPPHAATLHTIPDAVPATIPETWSKLKITLVAASVAAGVAGLAYLAYHSYQSPTTIQGIAQTVMANIPSTGTSPIRTALEGLLPTALPTSEALSYTPLVIPSLAQAAAPTPVPTGTELTVYTPLPQPTTPATPLTTGTELAVHTPLPQPTTPAVPLPAATELTVYTPFPQPVTSAPPPSVPQPTLALPPPLSSDGASTLVDRLLPLAAGGVGVGVPAVVASVSHAPSRKETNREQETNRTKDGIAILHGIYDTAKDRAPLIEELDHGRYAISELLLPRMLRNVQRHLFREDTDFWALDEVVSGEIVDLATSWYKWIERYRDVSPYQDRLLAERLVYVALKGRAPVSMAHELITSVTEDCMATLRKLRDATNVLLRPIMDDVLVLEKDTIIYPKILRRGRTAKDILNARDAVSKPSDYETAHRSMCYNLGRVLTCLTILDYGGLARRIRALEPGDDMGCAHLNVSAYTKSASELVPALIWMEVSANPFAREWTRMLIDYLDARPERSSIPGASQYKSMAQTTYDTFHEIVRYLSGPYVRLFGALKDVPKRIPLCRPLHTSWEGQTDKDAFSTAMITRRVSARDWAVYHLWWTRWHFEDEFDISAIRPYISARIEQLLQDRPIGTHATSFSTSAMEEGPTMDMDFMLTLRAGTMPSVMLASFSEAIRDIASFWEADSYKHIFHWEHIRVMEYIRAVKYVIYHYATGPLRSRTAPLSILDLAATKSLVAAVMGNVELARHLRNAMLEWHDAALAGDTQVGHGHEISDAVGARLDASLWKDPVSSPAASPSPPSSESAPSSPAVYERSGKEEADTPIARTSPPMTRARRRAMLQRRRDVEEVTPTVRRSDRLKKLTDD